ncbi:hypothetical protein QBC34DRAFT_420200 [Podospora aff. communis PSN243]|uniref:Transmembrane protein n=1 Tax=Podospora aff. communis PSN243 TaxID=3040156 RepID=A0AAV9H3V7_9PEZI|nr:hypothetical protein QBC34DRAFT_420200 [Podospora aff. communis PSN243]
MYRTNNFSWKLAHVLCILAQLGLAVAGAVAYIYNASKDMQMRAIPWSPLVRRSAAPPCHDTGSQQLVLATSVFHPSATLVDASLHTLPMSCLAVGVFGLVINIGLFIILLRAERTKVTLTEGEQHWRKQVVTFFSCISNLLLAGAGTGLAGALGMKLSESKSLITPMVWAAIQVLLSIATALFDAVKNHRDGRDLLD